MTHELIYNTKSRLTDTENRSVVSKGRGGEGGMDWEFGISR